MRNLVDIEVCMVTDWASSRDNAEARRTQKIDFYISIVFLFGLGLGFLTLQRGIAGQINRQNQKKNLD